MERSADCPSASHAVMNELKPAVTKVPWLARRCSGNVHPYITAAVLLEGI